MVIVLKQDTPEIVARQLEFFEVVGNDLVPSHVRGKRADAYVYEWVEGKEASSYMDIETLVSKMPGSVWKRHRKPAPPATEDRVQYNRYVMEKAQGIFRREELRIIEGILTAGIIRGSLHGAWQVHGDLTLENVIVRSDGGGLVLIDPGHPRGLYCEELDISKLMQSVVTHWEMAVGKRVHTINPSFFKIRPEALALLLSHWIRLLPHRERHNELISSYGRHVVVPAIIDESRGKEWETHASSDGSGWGPDRLSQRCLRGLQERL